MNFIFLHCRMSAVAYLASYLARAQFIPVSFVGEMLERLLLISFSWYDDI